MKNIVLFVITCVLLGCNKLDPQEKPDEVQGWSIYTLPSNEGHISKAFSFSFTDFNNGYVLAEDIDVKNKTSNYLVLKTIDGCKTWSTIEIPNSSKAALNSILFTDANTGFIFGYANDHIIFKTSDGGKNWTSLSLPEGTPYDINSICFVNQNIGYTVGPNCLLKTEDGGLTWSLNCDLRLSYLSKVHFLDAKTGYLIVMDSSNPGIVLSLIYATRDGGNSWLQIGSGNPYGGTSFLYSIYFIDSNVGFAVGKYVRPRPSYDEVPVIIKTNTGPNIAHWIELGASFWIEHARSGPLRSVYFANNNDGYVLGQILFKTKDGGTTWEEISFNGNDFTGAFVEMKFFDANKGYMLTSNGKILKTTSGGE